MKMERSLQTKTYIFVATLALLGPLGNVLVGKGMKSIGEISSWPPGALFGFFWRAFTTPIIWLGLAVLLASFITYMLVLSWADFSFVQSTTAISYAVVALLTVFLLHEVVKPTQWAGIAIICIGVLVVGNTKTSTTNRANEETGKR